MLRKIILKYTVLKYYLNQNNNLNKEDYFNQYL